MAGMHRFKLFIILCGLAFSFSSCDNGSSGKKFRDTAEFDFAHPKAINLPTVLDEISGIAYYPKDTSVFAIIDEDGLLFKIPLKNPSAVRQWRFGKQRDYEDIVLSDSSFYILVSNGDIEKITFHGDRIHVNKAEFPGSSKKANEFEALYYDPANGRRVLLCKECDEDKKTKLSSFFLVDSTREYTVNAEWPTAPYYAKIGSQSRIKPSAAAINPLTGDLFILSSLNALIIIQDAQGKLKDIIKLNPKIYKQPEGMTFTPQGDLVISNEVFLEGYGQLLLLKNKKTR